VDVGVGLPAAVPGVTPLQLLEWARRAERLGFSSLGVLDRLAYGNCESLVTLGAAAAVTERIGLIASVLVAPYRGNAALLAKQAATVDWLSSGRLVVGVSAGGRVDDFTASGTPYAGRGRRLDQMLAQMLSVWSGVEPSGPSRIGPLLPPQRPPLLVGGHSDAAMTRAATYGNGWIAGASSAAGYGALAARARALWSASGRTDQPRMVALANFALGDGARERAERYLSDYYAFLGPKAERAAAAALTDPVSITTAVREHERLGCDELVLFPCDADPGQVSMLAPLVLR
jgi:alkanesulfonate monooxygenase SsuD/methylene tetrahydromethanopterin reductase-like flavin-dependent oxidoreductase (luciferase family)